MAFVMDLGLANRVKHGLKTTHRIRVRKGRYKPEISDTEAIQAKGTEGRRFLVCHVEVLDVERRLLHEITEPEAIEEGHGSVEAFLAWWREMHDLEGPGTEQARVPVPVWVVRFKLDDRRFLAKRLETTEHGEETDAARGYVHQPTELDHLESVPADVQAKISAGLMASPSQQQYELERAQEAATRLARKPETQIAEELEALRAIAPNDAKLYEARVADLAARIKAKRKRRAA